MNDAKSQLPDQDCSDAPIFYALPSSSCHYLGCLDGQHQQASRAASTYIVQSGLGPVLSLFVQHQLSVLVQLQLAEPDLDKVETASHGRYNDARLDGCQSLANTAPRPSLGWASGTCAGYLRYPSPVSLVLMFPESPSQRSSTKSSAESPNTAPSLWMMIAQLYRIMQPSHSVWLSGVCTVNLNPRGTMRAVLARGCNRRTSLTTAIV